MSTPEQLPLVGPVSGEVETKPEAVPTPLQGSAAAGMPVEIRRSARRKRTVTAYREGGRTIVLAPARMSDAEVQRYVAELVERLDRRERRRSPGDAELLARATELSRRWLDGRAVPASVRWVSNQRTRWGSCTPTDGAIRLSDRMRGMPDYVVDAVLLHELAHLIHPNHSKQFWALVKVNPEHDRASAYLDGAAFGQNRLARADD